MQIRKITIATKESRKKSEMLTWRTSL